jgi:hypothetical protein
VSSLRILLVFAISSMIGTNVRFGVFLDNSQVLSLMMDK